jgi:hypothetical protein
MPVIRKNCTRPFFGVAGFEELVEVLLFVHLGLFLRVTRPVILAARPRISFAFKNVITFSNLL